MSTLNYSRSDIIGDFLPDVVIRRVTLESAPDDQLVTTIDLEVEDVLADDIRSAAIRKLDKQPDDSLTDLEHKFDEALKVCVVVATTPFADRTIRNLLVRRGGQAPTFQEKLRQIRGAGLEYLQSPTIKQAMENLAASTNDIQFFSEVARPVNGEQYVASTVELLKTYDSNNNPVYRLPRSFSVTGIPANVDHFSFYAFTFIDFSVFDIDIPAEEMKFLNNLYGKMVYNKTISGGQTNPFSMVLLDSKGTPWTGPYHVMLNGRYMPGRFHNEGDSEYLTSIMVPNLKVQDFRTFKRSEADLYVPKGMPSFLQNDLEEKLLKSKRSNQFNSRLEVEYEPTNGNVTFEFLIDQEQILRENSKFGSIYQKLPNVTKYNVLRPRDYFRLVSAKVRRRRVTDNDLGINSLGFGAKDVFDRNEPDFIVAETGEPHRAANESSRRFGEDDVMLESRTNQGSISDESFAELASSIGSEGFTSWINSSPDDPVPLASYRTLPFPFYRNIIGADRTLRSIDKGVYQYGIELTYEDGIERYLTEILKSLQVQTKILEEYYNECAIPVTSAGYLSRAGVSSPSAEEINPDYRARRIQRTESRGNYNHIRKAFAPDFVNYANGKYNFTRMAEAYFEVVNVVYADASFRIGNVSRIGMARFDIDNILSLMLPDNSRPSQILEILGSFQEMQSLLEDIVDVDLIKDASNVQLTPGQAGSSGRAPSLITVQRWYSDVDDFVDASDRSAPSMEFLDMVSNPPGLSMSSMSSARRPSRASSLAEDLATQRYKDAMAGNYSQESAEDLAKQRYKDAMDGKYSQESAEDLAKQRYKDAMAGKYSQEGQRDYSAEDIKNRLMKEMDKFDTGVEDGKYDNTPASLTFDKFNIPGPDPLSFSFKAEGEDSDEDEALVLRYERRSGRSRRGSRGSRRRRQGQQSSQYKVMDYVIRREEERKKDSLGSARPLVLGRPTRRRRRGSKKLDFIDGMKRALESELASEKGNAIFIREMDKKSVATVDSARSLCREVSTEPSPVIEFLEDLSAEVGPEFEITDKAAAVAEIVRKTVEQRIAKDNLLHEISVAKIKRVLEENPPEKFKKSPARKIIKVAAAPKEKANPPATAAGWHAGVKKAASNKKELLPDIQPSEVKKKNYNPPMQILKLAEEETPVGATPAKAPAVLYGSVKKIMKLEGFKKDAKGKPMLGSPEYKEVSVAEVKKGLPEGKYKLESYENSEMDIKSPEAAKKPVRFKVSKVKPAAPAKAPKPASVLGDIVKEDRKQAKKAEAKMEKREKPSPVKRKDAPFVAVSAGISPAKPDSEINIMKGPVARPRPMTPVVSPSGPSNKGKY